MAPAAECKGERCNNNPNQESIPSPQQSRSTETSFPNNVCDSDLFWHIVVSEGLFLLFIIFFCPTEAEHSLQSELISALSPVCKDSRSFPILNVDHITGEGEGQ